MCVPEPGRQRACGGLHPGGWGPSRERLDLGDTGPGKSTGEARPSVTKSWVGRHPVSWPVTSVHAPGRSASREGMGDHWSLWRVCL